MKDVRDLKHLWTAWKLCKSVRVGPRRKREESLYKVTPFSGEQYSRSDRSGDGKPPWRQPRGKTIVSLVNSHTKASSMRQHLREIDSRFAPGLLAGWDVAKEGGRVESVCLRPACSSHIMYLSTSFRKSTPPQNHQLI